MAWLEDGESQDLKPTSSERGMPTTIGQMPSASSSISRDGAKSAAKARAPTAEATPKKVFSSPAASLRDAGKSTTVLEITAHSAQPEPWPYKKANVQSSPSGAKGPSRSPLPFAASRTAM
mmetsp:Transcript_48335/g.134379  ORF Transcript_48335/g.134379 Transcript_48335/m.134379 type:complete len:120 (-) Transcript_48335:324-683(-)